MTNSVKALFVSLIELYMFEIFQLLSSVYLVWESYILPKFEPTAISFRVSASVLSTQLHACPFPNQNFSQHSLMTVY
jgi:hypothetical protein